MSSLNLHHLFYREEVLTQNSLTFRYEQGHHLHPSWEKLEIPGRFWSRFQSCLYSLSGLSHLLLPYPPRGFSHGPAWAARILFYFRFSLWISTSIYYFFSCSECPLWLIFPLPLLIFMWLSQVRPTRTLWFARILLCGANDLTRNSCGGFSSINILPRDIFHFQWACWVWL